MKRGEIWTLAGGGDYTGKPRHAVIIQDDAFDAGDSITICPLTSDPLDLPLFRLEIPPSGVNSLDAPSRIMVDKITTVARRRLGRRLSRLDAEDIVRPNRAIAACLGLASSSGDQDAEAIE